MTAAAPPPPSPRLRRWQATTVAVLTLGYAGYYVCRSNFSVALPLLIDELVAGGMDADTARVRLGGVASLGVFAYALGKFAGGRLGDWLGGRHNFLIGMAGSVLCTLAFAASGSLPLFTLAWIGNRAVQSLGWVGMVKITSRWFSWSAYGAIMGLISLSYLFGDAAARQLMGSLIGAGFGWRGVFLTAAGVLALLFAAAVFLLRETPSRIGEAEPASNPGNVFGAAGQSAEPLDLRALLAPLFRSRAFWLVCGLSLAFTLLRETFNTWTPTYFSQVLLLSDAEAASRSALFPLLGGVSVLLAGFLGDRLGRGGRAAIIALGATATVAALLALALGEVEAQPALAVGLVATVAFLLLGPYSFLAGAIALDLGGKRGSATACGIIDGVGYLGGVLAGDGVARLSVAYGWQGAFGALAGVAALASVLGCLYWYAARTSGDRDC